MGPAGPSSHIPSPERPPLPHTPSPSAAPQGPRFGYGPDEGPRVWTGGGVSECQGEAGGELRGTSRVRDRPTCGHSHQHSASLTPGFVIWGWALISHLCAPPRSRAGASDLPRWLGAGAGAWAAGRRPGHLFNQLQGVGRDHPGVLDMVVLWAGLGPQLWATLVLLMGRGCAPGPAEMTGVRGT